MASVIVSQDIIIQELIATYAIHHVKLVLVPTVINATVATMNKIDC